MQPETPKTPQNTYISKMREKYPQNNNLDDVTLAKIVRAKHYPDTPEGDFFTRIGLQDNTATEVKKDVAFEPFVKVEEPATTEKVPNPHVTKMREKYPMYENIDDFTLAKAVKEKHYADMDSQDFFEKVALANEFQADRDKIEVQKQVRIAENRPTINTGIDFIDNNLVNDFTLGAGKNILGYGASAVKGVGKIGGALGFDDFEKKSKVAQDKFNKGLKRADDSIDNEYVALAGEMLGDPINLAPAGIFTQGTKAARVAKSMAGGAVVGGATMAAKNYGDDAITQDQKNMEIGIGAGFVSALNGIIAGVTKGRVTGVINDIPDLESMQKNPEAFGVTPEEAEQVATTAKEHLKKTKQPKASEEMGLTINKPVVETTELDQIDNGFKALADKIMPDKENEIIPYGMNEPKNEPLGNPEQLQSNPLEPEQITPKVELSKQQQLLNAEAEANNNLRIAKHKHSINQPIEASIFEAQAQTNLDKVQMLKNELKESPEPIIEKPVIGEPEPEAVVKDSLTTQQDDMNVADISQTTNTSEQIDTQVPIAQPDAPISLTDKARLKELEQKTEDELTTDERFELEDLTKLSNQATITPITPIIEKPVIGEPEPEAKAEIINTKMPWRDIYKEISYSSDKQHGLTLSGDTKKGRYIVAKGENGATNKIVLDNATKEQIVQFYNDYMQPKTENSIPVIEKPLTPEAVVTDKPKYWDDASYVANQKYAMYNEQKEKGAEPQILKYNLEKVLDNVRYSDDYSVISQKAEELLTKSDAEVKAFIEPLLNPPKKQNTVVNDTASWEAINREVLKVPQSNSSRANELYVGDLNKNNDEYIYQVGTLQTPHGYVSNIERKVASPDELVQKSKNRLVEPKYQKIFEEATLNKDGYFKAPSMPKENFKEFYNYVNLNNIAKYDAKKGFSVTKPEVVEMFFKQDTPDVLVETVPLTSVQARPKEDYAQAYEKMPTDMKEVAGKQGSLGFEGTQNALFDTPASKQYIVPNWAKPLVSDTTRYEDIITAVTNAKNGNPTELANRAVDAIKKEELFQHPRLEELLTMRENILATDAQSPKNLVAKRDIRTSNNGNGWETDVTGASYEKNYNYDFEITKQDVKNIRAGKIDNIIGKLERDLGVLDNHPDWAKSSNEIEDITKADKELQSNPMQPQTQMSKEDWDEANSLFSKGIDNVAVGTYAGIEEDENGNISFDPAKFVLGLGGYTAVKSALKNKSVQGKLKEYAEDAINKIDMNPAVYKENGLNAMSPVKSKEQKEMRGIYNVTFNGKNSSEVRKADSDELIQYAKGNKNQGAIHIQKHLGDGSIGEVTTEELVNIGDVIRNGDVYENYGKNVYELEKDGVRFRAITGSGKNDNEKIITFYSDRNLEEKKGYEISLITNNSSSIEKIIPQTKEEWNKNLTEWHQESHPLTKNEDGTPKVFYHGTMTDFSEFKNTGSKANGSRSGEGFYFTADARKANSYAKKGKDGNVMPVYLNAKNIYKSIEQLTPEQKQIYLNTEKPTNEILQELGFDARAMDDKEIVIFKPTQIKSINNKGTFDTTNPNILMANGSNAFGGGLGGGLMGGMEDTDGNYVPDSWNWRNASIGALAGMGVGHFAKGEGTGMFGGKAFTTTYNKFKAGKLPKASSLPDETIAQLSQRKLQDKFNRVKQLINVKADINKIDDVMNPYQAEELMHGRIEDKIRELETKTVTPILEKISKAKLTTDQVDEYLWARHAPERNAKMLENHGKENGSGMNDTEAYTIINRYANNQAMQDIANDVYKMNRDRLKYIHSEGLESEDFIMMLDANYDNYVPLRREFADKESFFKTGKGFDIRGRETMRAVGSDRKVESPLMHSILAYEETIVRSEKNQVGKAFLEFTKEFPDESLYSVAGVTHMPQYDKNGAVVGMSPNYKKDDNVLHVKVLEEVNKKGADGKVIIGADGKAIKELKSKIKEIAIHDPALATAFKNLNSQQMNSLLLASQKAVRVIAGLSTSYNPEFVVTNFTRDIQTAMINMPDGMKANRATIIKDVPFAMKGIYSSLRDGSKNEWSTLFEEMRKEGGTTGWHDLHGVLDMKKSTQATIDKYDGKVAPVQAFKEVLNYINDVNGAVENASRLVAYKMAKDSGKTNKQAASIAKNLTVNFNRKGEMGAGLNALYMFYNASIQGSARMVQQLVKSRTSQALVAGIATSGVVLDMWNRSQNAEAYALIDDYIKDTNYIFMYKDGTYNTLKLPYGYNVFKATGDLASKMYHGEMEASKIPKRILSMTVNAFSPIGVDAESITHTVAPTLAKPFVEIAENKNFFGGNIAPAKNPFEPEKPDSQNYFKSVNPLAKVTAQKMNELTGGNLYEKGAIDVSPESIEHLVEFATGGLGKLVLRTGTVVDQALDKEKEVDMNKVPFLRGVYGVPREKVETNIIYKMYKESGANTFSELERNRYMKWTAAALEKKDITSDQAKKLKKVFNDNQRRLDFANKYNLQNKEEYQSSETLQDAGRSEGLTKQQRKELLKEDK